MLNQLFRHEEVPGYAGHSLSDASIEHRLSELVLQQVEVNSDHFDHMSAQHGEMLVFHRLHVICLGGQCTPSSPQYADVSKATALSHEGGCRLPRVATC